jgi:tRNA(fMet)-specific endonuclease VapC
MSLFVLDTDILALLQAGHPQVNARAAARAPGEIAITVITVDEQLRGWFTLVHRAKKPKHVAFAYHQLARSVSDLSRTRILPYSETAIAAFELLLQAKLKIRANDLRIAAIAMEYGGTVITRNARDFGHIPNVVIDDWSN